MIVLVGECAIYVIAWAWPNCLGLEVNPEDLTRSLQKNYGNTGQEQFTSAIDLAQTLVRRLFVVQFYCKSPICVLV
jgi:hypothetical protein